MERLRRAFERNVDVVALGAVLLVLGPLMTWWSVLVRRNILMMDRVMRAQGELVADPVERERGLLAIDIQTNRQLFMIHGETGLALVVMVVLVMALFAVARHRRNENQRMHTLLQLTSHQLKTPIAGVRTLLQSLENGSIPGELQRQFLGRGVAECDRLEHMVETILAYQGAAVRREPRLEVVDSQHLLDEILAHRHATFPSEGVSWSARAPSSIRCDPDALHVVVENLLDNARKYGGGSVELTESIAGTRWRLAVKDAGKGFKTADVERLFEPFERGGGAGVAHGSGLGLFIARQLMRRMGGDLRATSPGPEKGATFTLELEGTALPVPQPEIVHG
jgi:signal transduction histidine kinase